jgi:hypothetical protein
MLRVRVCVNSIIAIKKWPRLSQRAYFVQYWVLRDVDLKNPVRVRVRVRVCVRLSFFDEEYVGGQRVPSPIADPQPPRVAFFDEEYVEGQRVPSLTAPPTEPALLQPDTNPNKRPPSPKSPSMIPPKIAKLRDNIQHALDTRRVLPEFPATRIPKPEFNLGVTTAMNAQIEQRDRIEVELVTLHERDAVQSLPDYDEEYLRLTTRLNDINNTLFEIYAQFIDKPSRPYPDPDEPSANLAMTLPDTANEIPCPYQHISALEPPPVTRPDMAVITLNEVTARALFARVRISETDVTALADYGASHIQSASGIGGTCAATSRVQP